MESNNIENEETFLKLKNVLDENQIEYKLLEHEPTKTSEESAKIRGTSLKSGAKALLVKADSGMHLIVIPANLKFDSKLAKKVLKTKNLRFAELDEVLNLTKCLSGAVPPFGSLFGIPTYLDKAFYDDPELENMNFNGGLRTKSILMKRECYLNYENPVIAILSKE